MPSSIRKALNKLPITLDDTYERALQGVPKEKRQHAHRLFQCLVAAIRPLRAEELAEIFAIDFEQDVMCNIMEGWRPGNPEEAVLSTCSTLITIIEDEGSRIIQFSHFSVKEFLTSDRLRTSEVGSIRDYHIPLNAAHTILTQACLAVLLQLDGKVGPETFPLVSYAARHWVEHAQYEDVATRVQGSMEELFNPKKPHLAAWVSIHDVSLNWGFPLFVFDGPEHPLSPEAAALFLAGLCGFDGVVDYLIMAHAQDVNARYHYSMTPLHVASAHGYLEVVYLLLQHNADTNVRCTGSFKWTPLHFASYFGHAKVIQLLLEHGADITAAPIDQYTALYYASMMGHLEAVRLLLGHGADVNIRPNTETFFQVATRNGHVETAQLLLEHGAETE
jgi:hypothetical protein